MAYDQVSAAGSAGTTATTFAAGNDSRITGAAQKASNLSDIASPETARVNLGYLERRQGAARNLAMVVGISGANFLCPAGGDTGAYTGTANGLKRVSDRQWYGLKAANTTNGGAVGGWAPSSTNTLYWSTSSGCPWEFFFNLYIPAASTLANLRLWVGVRQASGNHPNSADGADTHLGAYFDGVGGATTWTASARSAAGVGNQTTATFGPTVTKETGMTIRVYWTGAQLECSYAAINADGTTGDFGAAGVVAADLPADTVPLQWCVACYQDGTPGAAQEMYIGDTDSVIGAI